MESVAFPEFPEIPPERIAQAPLKDRAQARLFVLDRRAAAWRHDTFQNIAELFKPGDVLVLNNTRVFPARLWGRKPTGGKVAALLLGRFAGPKAGRRWTCLLKPSLKPGAIVHFSRSLSLTVMGPWRQGEFVVEFTRAVEPALARLGRMPLPPYIHTSNETRDRTSYQTVYAKSQAALPVHPEEKLLSPGAVAAPTAGLHFTPGLLARLKKKGVNIQFICLNVGWGTFRPIRGDYRTHSMLPEAYSIPASTAKAVTAAKDAGARVWAVGTTTARALEGAAAQGGVRAVKSATSLYIVPGHQFKVVDAFVTNFHLSGHTPLLLTAAFAGPDLLKCAYEEALKENYRFFSYGDAMAVM